MCPKYDGSNYQYFIPFPIDIINNYVPSNIPKIIKCIKKNNLVIGDQ